MGKVALVTGASSGFGMHFARVLAEAGADVVVAARRADRLASLAADLQADGHNVAAVALDVNDEASIDEAFDAAEAAMGGRVVDVLINNAGIAIPKLSLQARPRPAEGMPVRATPCILVYGFSA